MTINKKIKGATSVIVGDTKYRSKLESRCAQILRENNILFEYEPFKIEYIPKFEYKGIKYRAAYYTPDFVVDNKYILEIKGYANDVYRYKKKLVLLKLLQTNTYDFVEIKTLTELRKWIEKYKVLQKG
jgi:hypothetical protein